MKSRRQTPWSKGLPVGKTARPASPTRGPNAMPGGPERRGQSKMNRRCRGVRGGGTPLRADPADRCHGEPEERFPPASWSASIVEFH
jgi:hypothetical protein